MTRSTPPISRASPRGRRSRGSAALTLILAGCAVTFACAATVGCGHTSTQGSTQSSSAGTPRKVATAGSTSQPSGQSTSVVDDTVTGTSQGVTATLHAANHHPKVGLLWPIEFTATRAGHAARASVSYEYLFAGQVVARRSHYTFTGHFSDKFEWPASAVGYPLTLRAVIVAEGVTINLDFPVQVTA